MKKLFFVSTFLLSFFTFSQGTKESNVSIILLENDDIAEVNINQESFISTLRRYTDYCKTKFSDLTEKQKVSILLIAHPSGKATLSAYTNPKNEELESTIEKDLGAINLENTKILDFPILFSINCNSQEEALDFEGLVNPSEKRMEEYSKADMKTKVQLNKEYVIKEVLPVLAAYEVIVDDKFAGVKNLGKLVQQTDFSKKQDVLKMTDYNNDYWRATLEMEAGNQLIPMTKVAMLVSQGEFDYAMRYIEILSMFSNPKSKADDLMNSITVRLDMLYEELKKNMTSGITEHDKGNYKRAMEIYSNVLDAHPYSAWAMYEFYFSDNALKLKKNEIEATDFSNWYKVRSEIYSHNPVYDVDVHASTGKQAYQIMRRHELQELFHKKEDRLKDVFKYAEIATDLDAPGLAAQFFWLTATYDQESSEESINNFLYCLNKLGNTEIKSNFKGDFDKIFKKIDAQKEKEMKSSSIYNAFGKE